MALRFGFRKTPVEQARDALSKTVLSHIPVIKFDFHGMWAGNTEMRLATKTDGCRDVVNIASTLDCCWYSRQVSVPGAHDAADSQRGEVWGSIGRQGLLRQQASRTVRVFAKMRVVGFLIHLRICAEP